MNEKMDDAGTPRIEQEDTRPGTVLLRAREARGMSLADVAEVTRIAQRQLEAVERSDFGSLPGTPYAVGFARAYARAVGVDEVEIARGVREELGALGEQDRYEAFEPVDPARIPPRRLAWVAAAIAIVLAVAYGVWRTQFFAASTDEEISDLNNRATAVQAPAVTPTAAAPAANGPVVLTAISDVWLRIYDQNGERLFEKQMAKGESYTVPPEANNPMILTGRPDAIGVTVGGKAVPPLGAPEKTISDVPVSASALLARPLTADGVTSPASAPPASPSRSVPSRPAASRPTSPTTGAVNDGAAAGVAAPVAAASSPVASPE